MVVQPGKKGGADMNRIITRVSTTIATAALLASTFLPAAFAEISINISGNGSRSHSSVDFESNQSTTIVQSNDTQIHNNVSSHVNTGGNSASGNTGGDNAIRTGNATSDVKIVNHAGSNIASGNLCGCENSDIWISVHGNGSRSTSDVSVQSDKNFKQFQSNNTDIWNDVHNSLNTGRNRANDNTSGNWWWWHNNGGSTTIDTGSARSMVDIVNHGSSNVLY